MRSLFVKKEKTLLDHLRARADDTPEGYGCTEHAEKVGVLDLPDRREQDGRHGVDRPRRDRPLPIKGKMYLIKSTRAPTVTFSVTPRFPRLRAPPQPPS